ncbi:MAG: patatin-like phospholipase family protein [Bacteroidetes bacterium]|nr:patatin-like phospholipase family protein [Bacteroidota bacterium]MCW5894890.1 patatin-like phospholipase family protein [Bacteroidota bacterium]
MSKLALVLSGGGARGAFQAGALVELLEYFERTGRRINILSGTSVGALNGMSIAQAPDLKAARVEIETQWKKLTNDDIYKVRGWEIFKLIAKFATHRIEKWPTLAGVDSIFDNTPLYNKYVEHYLDLDAIRSRRTVDDFFVSLTSLHTGAAYLQCLTTEPDLQKAKEYIMASTITTVAYPPVKTVVVDPEIPEHLQDTPQLYADGGISNKTPLKTILQTGDINELFVVNTYPSYPNKTEESINRNFPNVFSMLIRTAVELLPNLYFRRDMESVQDVNNDIERWNTLKAKLLGTVRNDADRVRLEELLAEEEQKFSFKQGNKQIINPVIIAPDEELPVQDTEFVQPKLGETFEMGREKAKQVLAGLEERGVYRVRGVESL